MKRFLPMLHWEWRRIFSSQGFPTASGLFLCICSILFLFVVHLFAVEPQIARPTTLWLQTFWVGSLALVPLLSMGSIAEERSSGSLDGLLCTVVNPTAIIFCKFLALFGVYMLLWAIAIAIQPLSMRFASLGHRITLFLPEDLLCAGLFLALVGALHCSMGVLFSTITSTATQAAMATSAFQLLYFFGPKLIGDSSALPYGSNLRNFIFRLEIFSFMGEWSAGIFDSRQIVLHVSITVFALLSAAAFLRRP